MDKEAIAFKNGNTELLEVLMGMCNQYLSVDVDGTNLCNHDFMSCNEAAMDVLCQAGMAKEIGGNKFKLLWDELEKRKNP